METEILKQLQQAYPGVPVEVAGQVAALLEKAAGGDAARQKELAGAASELMGVLTGKLAQAEADRAAVEDFQQAQATAGQFREALGKELAKRGVPECFWKNAIGIDALTGELIPSADAIEGGYKAFLQEESDRKIDANLRPEQAVEAPKVSPAVENFLRSRKNDSPLAGKLKKTDAGAK